MTRNTQSSESNGIKRFVLECLKYVNFFLVALLTDTQSSFAGQHTGLALAKSVHAVLCKFKIENRASDTRTHWFMANIILSHRSGVLYATMHQTMVQC
jgi:hypothetical protein